MTRPLVIMGSARPDGDTRRIIDIVFPPETVEQVVLPNLAIGGYDYDHFNSEDAFGGIADAMVRTGKIVFATPVYWYAMSAPMKVFFDRLSDLMENRKAQGKQLAGKQVWLIASGAEAVLPEGFEVPFRRTAEYFDMQYQGATYVCTDGAVGRQDSDIAALKSFATVIMACD